MKTRIIIFLLSILSVAVFAQKPDAELSKKFKNVTVRSTVDTKNLDVRNQAVIEKTFVFDGIPYNTVPIVSKDTAEFAIDWTQGNIQRMVLNDTVEIAMTSPGYPADLVLYVQHAANTTSFPVYFNAPTVKWVGGTAFTNTATSGAIDIILLRYNGTYYYGSFQKDYK